MAFLLIIFFSKHGEKNTTRNKISCRDKRRSFRWGPHGLFDPHAIAPFGARDGLWEAVAVEHCRGPCGQPPVFAARHEKVWEGHVLEVKWRCQCEHVLQIYRYTVSTHHSYIYTYMYLPLFIVTRPPCVNFCVDSLIEFASSYKSSTVYSVQQMNPS